jgi:hypothetical protein
MVFTLSILLIIGAVAALGFFALNEKLDSLQDRAKFTEGYQFQLRNFISLRKDGDLENKLLSQLGSKAAEMEAEMVKPVEPGRVVLQCEDSLTDLLRSMRQDGSKLPQLEKQYQLIADHLAMLNNEITKKQKIFLRPVALLAQGVQMIFRAPIKTLEFAKILNSEQMHNLEYSAFMDKLSVITSYAGLIASAIAIITRWADYFALIDRFATM